MVTFHFSNVPISGNPRLLEKRAKEDVVAILDFIGSTLLGEDNIEIICQRAFQPIPLRGK